MLGAGRTPWMHTLDIFSLLLSEMASLFFQNLYNVPPGCSITLGRSFGGEVE